MHGGPGFFAFRTILLIVILSLFFLAQRFWFRRALEVIDRLNSPRQRRIARALLNLSAALIVVVLADRLFFHFLPRFTSWIAGLTQLWLFTSFFAFIAVRVVHAVEWGWSEASALLSKNPRRNPDGESIDLPRRSFFRYAAYLAGSLPLIAGIYGFTTERLRYRVRGIDVPVANLPTALDGLRIVQLSDIHIGDFMPPPEVRRAVDMANALGAHLAVITGDLVTGTRDPLRDCVAELSRLHAPLGIWGCNGNHEIYADAEDAAEELYQQHGMNLLRQRSAQLSWRGAQFNLIGVDYQRERASFSGPRVPMLKSIEPLIRRDMPNILLSHNPNSFHRAAELGIELSLAGHTHGGQIQVEIIDHRFSPARFITDFIAGLYRLPLGTQTGTTKAPANHAALYVNRGLGTIGVPARIGVEPEITLLTLRSA